jgi:type II secretory pathway pseudopilin PulG
MLLLVVVVMAVLMLSLLFSIVDRRDRKLGEIF